MSSEASGKDLVTIGKIVGCHGIGGELRLLPLTDYPERFRSMKTLDLYRKNGKFQGTFTVEAIRDHRGKGLLLVRLAGVTDPEDAEALRDCLVRIPSDERVKLPQGAYWIDDLLGLEVVEEETGRILGIVSDVIETGSNDVYLVRTPDGAEKALPAVREVVLEVDTEAGRIKVRLPEGLWD